MSSPDGAVYAATVPGCVHTDLMTAGVLDDPHLGDNEARSQWIGWTDWHYATRLTTGRAADEQIDLVFHGLDTIASVRLDGEQLGSTENMHRGYRFPITHLVPSGGDSTHELTVDFASAERFAAERVAETGGPRPNPFDRPYAAIRKMACNFGWDWGPDLVTAGIWRPVELHRWRVARLDGVRPLVRRDESGWTVEVTVDLVHAPAALPVSVTARVAGVEATISTAAATVVLRLAVDSPDLWWPTGYGAQPLYDLTVEVRRGDDLLDEWRRRIGFRTIELDTTPDEIGAAFVLRVNDRPVFARGVNWIPDDTFVTRVTPARYRERLTQALDANVNLVRVWGGGLYESDDFYDVCDELGLLVWQDFPFACSAYGEDDRLAREIEAEARENIVRLCPHPSLVLWNGNNENIWGWFDWGWPEALDGRAWGSRYYLDLLPRLVAELDPSRPYWAGSPYSGSMDRHPNDDRYGVSHVWNVWNEKDYLAYRDRVPRFVAEFGYEGPPTWSTFQRGIGDTEGIHQKAADGKAKLDRGLVEHFGTRDFEFDDWLFLTQLLQARAVRVGIDHFRSAQPVCMGTVWWQLNDCWPGPSWAVVDGDGRRKPAWYALRDAYEPRLLTIQPAAGGLDLVLVNDTDEPWVGRAALTRYGFDGTAHDTQTVDVTCPPRSARRFPVDSAVSSTTRPDRELVRAELSGLHADWFYLRDHELSYPVASYKVDSRPIPEGFEVEVVAETLLRDVCLFPDRIDSAAEVDRMLVTLLPGERAHFQTTVADPLLRCANERSF
jgi:beta-mannosidase